MPRNNVPVRPTRAVFEQLENSLTEKLRERGIGYYAPLYDNEGKEAEVAFFGWTGD